MERVATKTRTQGISNLVGTQRRTVGAAIVLDVVWVTTPMEEVVTFDDKRRPRPWFPTDLVCR
jgi:hypothetical protein